MAVSDLERLFEICNWQRKYRAEPTDQRNIVALWTPSSWRSALNRLGNMKEKTAKSIRSLHFYHDINRCGQVLAVAETEEE